MKSLDPLTVSLTGTDLIEASAGTGKTQTITTLYVRLLVERQLSPGSILVVTYTNAATAELRARIRRRVRVALRAFDSGGRSGDAPLDELARRRIAAGRLDLDRRAVLAALHGFDEAAISSIHGFCQHALQEHAFESGVAFDTELVTNQIPLLDEVVRDFWMRELHDAPAPLIEHLEGKVTPAVLAVLAAQVVSHPHMAVLPERSDDPAACAGDELDRRRLQLQLDLVPYARTELRRRKQIENVQFFDDLLQRLDEALAGSGGEALARKIRARFPAALIDEFQDTDPLQYDIFRRIYGDDQGTIFLIGDPKQAIYAFRGADVFAYMAAKRDAGHAHTLTTNWRSDPRLVGAVNTLFERARAPFVFDQIPFLSATPSPEAADHLGGTAAGQAPFQILFVERTGVDVDRNSGCITKGWAQKHVPDVIAAEIVRFLESGATIKTGDGEERVRPADIAVLCRTNAQAASVQIALRRLRVPSVLQTEASVFDSPEAVEVERVLAGVADPGDVRALKAALATTLMGVSGEEIFRLRDDEREWDEWLRRFQGWHEVWLQRGFVAGFHRLLDDCGVQPRLLALADGERRLTNVLHLAELLHTAAIEEQHGPLALVRWLGQMRADADARAELAGEAAQIRLESDAAAVKLVTVHKAKGLEYPVVFCPFLWDGMLLRGEEKKRPRFHDPDDSNRLKLDLGSSRQDRHRVLAEREVFAEQLRLLYVALTRAKHRCSIVWGAFRDAETSALGYLLHQPAEAGDDELAARTAERIKAFVRARHDDGMRADLEALALAANGGVEISALSLERGSEYTAPAEEEGALQCRTATRTLSLHWRVSSFSALVAGERAVSLPAAEGQDRDEAGPSIAAPEVREPAAAARVLLHDFPAGARPGQLLHEILQHLDFQHAEAAALQALVAERSARYGFEPKWTEPLCQAITNLLDTPLDAGSDLLSLRGIPLARRLSELEFLFPVDEDTSRPLGFPPLPPFDVAQGRLPATGEGQGEGAPAIHRAARDSSFTSARLADVFARHAAPPVPPDYAGRIRNLSFAPLAGYLKGFVDLVFEHAGRWYVIDYKSNFLGTGPQDYEMSRLTPAMAEHHYLLQYHLYVVALHRYLAVRLADYDYDRHVGAVYYLFLRGMSPAHARGCGIFRDRPSRALIEGLSAALASCATGSPPYQGEIRGGCR